MHLLCKATIQSIFQNEEEDLSIYYAKFHAPINLAQSRSIRAFFSCSARTLEHEQKPVRFRIPAGPLVGN